MDLRQALQNALDGKLTEEDREAIRALIKQRIPESDGQPAHTLLDECEICIWG